MFYIFPFGLCCFALASVAWHRRRSQFVFRADQQLMASTSTQLQQDGASLPSGSSSWKYDVFLSFRGTDTRNGFVDHLYSALHQKVIFTFKDDQRLEKGDSISPALLKAIEESRFAVVVFSEKYASSKWCLEELVKILECQKKRALTVLPVFYKVDPSDLRNQRGSVGEAFAQHERDSSEEKVQRWRNALTEAANSSGWHSETYGLEAKLVRDIAIDILNRLGHNRSSVLEGYVGLLPRIEVVMSKLEMGLDLDDPRIVGICGMGGIGKTAIAKAVYHQIHSQFVGSCYLANVRETCEKHGLESLQKSLLVGIRSVSNSDIKIRYIDWLGSIRNAVGNMRVLVVLDDVDHSDQLDALVGRLDWFGPGSRIIITTRNSRLLAGYGPRSSHVYNVEGLNDEEASKLFCCKAFWNNQPTPGFEHLTRSAVNYAKGVPLALKVVGRFLNGRGVNEWQSAIRRLGQQPDPDIQKVLKLSYDGLGCLEKKILLDIACFFKWYSMEYSIVVNMLDACGFHAKIGISVLKDKALVAITNNMIGMHDLIQEMGWHIVNEESLEEPGRRSRLWKYEDIYHTLTNKTGLVDEEESYILVPGREIPKYFRYQNNMGHYVGIQLRPDWYERLRGIFVCAVFEATAPSIDVERYAECYIMWNDDVVYSTGIYIGTVQFQSDHLFLHYISSKPKYISDYDWVGEIRRRAEEVNDLKKNEIIFYFRSSSPEIVDRVAPVKCAVHMVYEKSPDHPHLSIQQSDCNEYGPIDEYRPIEWMQGVALRKTELLESSIQNFLNSKPDWWHHNCCIDINWPDGV